MQLPRYCFLGSVEVKSTLTTLVLHLLERLMSVGVFRRTDVSPM